MNYFKKEKHQEGYWESLVVGAQETDACSHAAGEFRSQTKVMAVEIERTVIWNQYSLRWILQELHLDE